MNRSLDLSNPYDTLSTGNSPTEIIIRIKSFSRLRQYFDFGVFLFVIYVHIWGLNHHPNAFLGP